MKRRYTRILVNIKRVNGGGGGGQGFILVSF